MSLPTLTPPTVTSPRLIRRHAGLPHRPEYGLAVAAFCLILACLAVSGRSVERHSNGIGGGAWSDLESWKDRAVPGPTDTVVIATGDLITFDAHHPDSPSCAGLLLDPQATLEFKADRTPHTMTVAGPIESYGMIRLEADRAPDARIGLILAAPESSNRVIRLLRNSSFLALGVAGLPNHDRNITLTAGPPPNAGDAGPGSILAKAETILELHRTLLSDMIISATGIDNTGFTPKERLNLIENRFTGHARVVINYSDTPVLRRNVFEGPAIALVGHPAIYVNGCKLAQVEGNVITGRYASGILLANDTESSLAENTVALAGRGLYIHGRSSMIRRNLLTGCNPGLYMDSAANAVLEDTTVYGPYPALTAVNSTLQVANLRFVDRPETNVAITIHDSTVTLLNTPIRPDHVRFDRAGSVTAMDYVVVRVVGRIPPGATVTIRTAAASGGPPKDKADLNVRNSPAPLSPTGFTPLPASGRALVVKSWTLTPTRNIPPPFYDLLLLPPTDPSGAEPHPIASMVIEPKPTWYRADSSEPTPTVELHLP